MPADPSTLTISGHDHHEDQAERNEARIVAAASAGRWDLLEPTLERTLGARIQRRPLGSWLVRARLADLLPDPLPRTPGAEGGGVASSGGSGQGTLSIGTLTVRWAGRSGPTPVFARPQAKAQASAPTPARGDAPAPPGFVQALAQSPGQPLPPQVQARMEQALGADLSPVRIHTDPTAQGLSQQLGARAFTVGQDVFFGPGQYDPTSPRGLGLLGHELTHTVQQREGRAARARVLASPLGRGGLIEAAGSRQLARTAGLGRRPAPAAGPPPGPPPAGPPPRGPVGAGRIVVRSLVVSLRQGDEPPAAGPPGMDVVRTRADGPAVRAHGGEPGPAPGGVEELLQKSVGLPLPPGLAAQLAALLGNDFGDVRVHTDAPAGLAATALKAEAFALGRDVFFAPGRYDPTSPRGVALLGHELTHVAQQSGGAPTLRKAPTPPSAGQRAQALLGGDAGQTAEAMDDGLVFAMALDAALRRFDGPLSYDDPQRANLKEVWDFFNRTGGSMFNRAPPQGDFPGGAAATSQVETWLRKRMEGAGQATTVEDLIHQAVVANRGNVTLAMGSLAEVLYKDDNRAWAGRITGLRGNSKDYYLFAGAYVGLQPSLGTAALGYWGSKANIYMNPVVYSAWGAAKWAGSWFGDDGEKERKKAGRIISYTWDTTLNYHKLHEFNAGVVGAGLVRNIRQKSALSVAGHDAYEEQALVNERAIFQAFATGQPLPAAGAGPPSLLALQAAGRTIGRRLGPVVLRKPTSRWERFKSWTSERLQENAAWWDDVGVEGIQRGGVLGYSQAAFAAIMSGVNRPNLALAYVEGLGAGVVEGVKGVVNMVVHPIETAEGVYRLVVNFDDTKAGLKAKVAEYVEAASSDPEKFARMTGELVGQIEVALVGPKVIGGPREVVGAVRTLRNVVPKGRTLWYYSSREGAELIRNSGRIGRAGAKDVFATGLDPLLGGSNSMLGVFARQVFLGGRLDFVKEAGRLLPRLKIKEAFTHATGFSGGGFKLILFTEVETAITRVFKSVFPQYAAVGQQQVKVLTTMLLTDQRTLYALLDGAGMLGSGSNMVIGNTEVPFKDVIQSALEFYGMEGLAQALRKEKRGGRRDPLEDLVGEDLGPRERWRLGGRLGRALEALEDPGLPLELGLKLRLEREVGGDLGAMRVHTGLAAERLASALGAEAFALGHRVVVGEGAWRPDAPEGLGTLAHEAVHVLQSEQGRLVGPATPSRTAGLEAEAHARERDVLARAAPVGRPAVDRRPAPPPLVLREAGPRVDDLPAPVAAADPGVARALRKGKRSKKHDNDPVQRVMDAWHVTDLSREEFVATCSERVLELMREEIEIENERGGTLSWTPEVPLA